MAVDAVSSGSSSGVDEMGSINSIGGDTLNRNAIYCLPRLVPTSEADEATSKLKTEGFKVIREDVEYTFYALPEAFSSSQVVQASQLFKPESLPVKQEAVRDVSKANIHCGGVFSVQFPFDLPLGESQHVGQKLTVGVMLRTLKVKDAASEWARVEITSVQWTLQPNMISDDKCIGYFVDKIEVKLSPKWTNPSLSCAHEPKREKIKRERTTSEEVEKSGSIQLNLKATNPGANLVGGAKKKKGSQETREMTQCDERWLVGKGVTDGRYVWDMNYWQNEDNARKNPNAKRKGIISHLPSVPETSMFENLPAKVDWLWPRKLEDHKYSDPLEWDFTCSGRVVFLAQKEETKLLRNVSVIQPSIENFEIAPKAIRWEMNPPLSNWIRQRLSQLILLRPLSAPERWVLCLMILMFAVIIVQFM